jgi:hypothetical protein
MGTGLIESKAATDRTGFTDNRTAISVEFVQSVPAFVFELSEVGAHCMQESA